MLRLVDVTVSYGSGTAALEPTTLAFAEGQFTVLLGASGAGKSTLLRSLNGLVRPTVGDVLRAETGSIFARSGVLRTHRRSTGMIFQQHHLMGRLSVLNNVMIGRLGHRGLVASLLPATRIDRHIALSAIDRVGLLDRALDRADKLSGGQQQRVGIARALAQKPRIVLADEPVASLDPATAEKVLSDLHRICREDGITAVVSLHQVEFARRFADRIIGLSKGRIVFDGPPRDLNGTAASKIYESPPPEMARAAE
ncbi:MAG: phosphonate ABC transporter ATP-binding protein [Hyphomicrobium sp.]